MVSFDILVTLLKVTKAEDVQYYEAMKTLEEFCNHNTQ